MWYFHNIPIYNVDDFPYQHYFPKADYSDRRDGWLDKRIFSFDIETTRIRDIEQAVMYVWQFAIEDQAVIIGRTWEEYKRFINLFTSKNMCNIIVYVHNLSYEFQFLRSVFNFEDDSVFIVRSRRILKAKTGRVIYRCSYLHSNMSLEAYTHKYNVGFAKVRGFNYDKLRFPWTPLTRFEYSYIIADVIGLNQALRKEMLSDGDNIKTIPLTSTGYVRRDLRAAMKQFSHKEISKIQPPVPVFIMLIEGFRGGNTHANRCYVYEILEDVHSIDRSSSYPDVEVNDQVPMGKWFYQPAGSYDAAQILRIMKQQKRAFITRVQFRNIHLKEPLWGCPYLSKDKCRNVACFTDKKPYPDSKPLFVQDGKEWYSDDDRMRMAYDNGRILYADILETTVTDVDLRIIMDEYTFSDIQFFDFAHSAYGRMPEPWREVVKEYYIKKTELKNVPGQELYYDKSKNKLNATFGDTVQNPARVMEVWKKGDYAVDDKPIEVRIQEAEEHPYKSFAWGVWVTAWARYRLEEMIRIAHHAIDPKTGMEFNGFVYADTDSVKYTGQLQGVDEYNKIRRDASKKSGAYATDKNGVTHYMGVYEPDGDYKLFKTLGAKKYVYVDQQNELHITIAGVNKKLGPGELRCIKRFQIGFEFKDAGGTESVYNDQPYGWYYVKTGVKPKWQRRRGVRRRVVRRIWIGSNVVLRPSTYKIGIAGEYKQILERPEIYLDLFNNHVYTGW